MKSKLRKIFEQVVFVVWFVMVLIWPLLKWVLSIYVFIVFVRMIVLWGEPGAYAVWTFIWHFSVLAAVTYFVSVYKPKKEKNG